MGISDLISKVRAKGKERKELIRRMDEQMRAEEILESRKKSANERELERFFKEKREEQIKIDLDEARKIRDRDIKFNHNPLDTPNITNHVDWEVLKERNMFSNKSNIFSNHKFIHKGNPKLLKNERWLF